MSQRPAVPDGFLARGRTRGSLPLLLSLVLVSALCVLGAQPAFSVSMAPGWPVASPSGARPASALADLDGDGDLEVIHPASTSRLYVYHHTGALAWVYDWQEQTGSGSGGWGSPVVGDIDGDGDPEIVITATAGTWAFHSDGSVVAGWPIDYGAQMTPALADLDGDGVLEVVTVTKDVVYPNTSRVVVYKGDGSVVAGWPQAVVGGVTDGGPSVADIDADGGLEVVVATTASAGSPNVFAWHANGAPAAGWPQSLDGGFYSTPALGNLDGGQGLDVVLASYDGQLYALHADGSPLAGWPKRVNASHFLTSSPVLGDLDGDGLLEAVIGSYDSKICAWNGDGTSPAGWPVPMPSRVDGSSVPTSLALGDIDGDGALEVVTATNDPTYRLYTVNNDGSFVSGWPPAATLTGATTAVIADLDMDGDDEVVLGATSGGVAYTYVFSCDLLTEDRLPWPMFAGNAQRTGVYAAPIIAPVADFSADPASGLAPLTVSFTDLSANTPTSWQWDFGDGATSTAQNPIHQYADPGYYTVSLTAMNAGGADDEVKVNSIHVISPDVTPPVLNLPADIVVEAAGPEGTVVTFTVTATDDMDPSPLVTVSPGSGSLFPLGVTTVNCTATDAGANTATGSFTVTVQDTVAPTIVAPADVVSEATGARTYPALGVPVVTDAADAAPAVTNDAPSGFPVGTTVVTWTATDASGNAASATQHVTIVDTTGPSLALPADIRAEAASEAGAVVEFVVSAQDLVDGSVAVQSVPASGSTFPFGITTVVCTATDAAGNTASGEFTVTVADATPPAIAAPADLSVEATGPLTAVALGTPTVSDAADSSPVVTNDAPAGFPLGETIVTWTVTDDAGNTASAQQHVTVVDTTGPSLVMPANLVVEATSAAGAAVEFVVSAHDLVEGSVAVLTAPASGSVFPLGTTEVACSASDSAGNAASGSFTVTVVDTTAPALVAPAGVTAEATGLRTSVALGAPAVADAVDANPLVANDAPAEGFLLGTTLVTWIAQDWSGNGSSAAQQVTVVDTTAPVLQVPPAVSVKTSDPNGTAVDIGMATASDLADPAPVIANDAPAVFPIGVTIVTWTATDASGNTATGTQTVTVTSEQRYANFVWLAPVANADRRLFKRGSTIPLKFRITDLAGNPVPNAVAKLNIRYLVAGAPDGEPVVISTDPGDVGDQFRYSASGNLYIFNLSTRDPSYVNFWYYAADVTLDDGTVYTINFSLK